MFILIRISSLLFNNFIKSMLNKVLLLLKFTLARLTSLFTVLGEIYYIYVSLTGLSLSDLAYLILVIMFLLYCFYDFRFYDSFYFTILSLLFSFTDPYSFNLFLFKIFNLFISFIFLFRYWAMKNLGLNNKESKFMNDSTLRTYYITFINIDFRAKKVLKYFNNNDNCFKIKCTYSEYRELEYYYRKLYSDSCIRIHRMSFFNFVLGNIIYDNIIKTGNFSSLDRGYFLLHFNRYVLFAFFNNQVINNKYLCEDVLLNLSLSFWLDQLDSDGSFKLSFLSQLECYDINLLSKHSVSIFIHSYNVCFCHKVSLGDRSLIDADIASIKDLGLKDGKSLDNFILLNSNVLFSEYGINDSDWITINHKYMSSSDYKKFLINGGSF